MSLNDWILSLHLLSAFSMMGAITFFTITMVAIRSADTPSRLMAFQPMNKIGNVAVFAGVGGTIVFGVWLAISRDAYQIWDGWIIASLVLWAIAVESGRRVEAEYEPAAQRAAELAEAGRDEPDPELSTLVRTQKGLALHTISTVATVAILVLMIWKPGA